MRRFCEHCGLSYDPDRSTAELRLTYCTGFCESSDMVPVSVLLRAERQPRAGSQLTEEEKSALEDLIRDDRLLHEGGG